MAEEADVSLREAVDFAVAGGGVEIDGRVVGEALQDGTILGHERVVEVGDEEADLSMEAADGHEEGDDDVGEIVEVVPDKASRGEKDGGDGVGDGAARRRWSALVVVSVSGGGEGDGELLDGFHGGVLPLARVGPELPRRVLRRTRERRRQEDGGGFGDHSDVAVDLARVGSRSREVAHHTALLPWGLSVRFCNWSIERHYIYIIVNSAD